MGWYIRHSVRVGPVRFNFSKSGVGTSIGVKGFRVGIRPNGKKYIHAGGGGIYFREELGSRKNNETRNKIPPSSSNLNVTSYDSVAASGLLDSSRKELIDALNSSYTRFRVDYLIIFLFFALVAFYYNQYALENAITIFFVGAIAIFTAVWESRRRTIVINYDFEYDGEQGFKKIINSFNSLASNSNVWSMVNSRNIYGSHESKLNAGAGNLVNRTNIKIGEGKPPWVDTNIDVPILKTVKITLYMMPDGILVYDSDGVGFVDYKNIDIDISTTRFIEENPPRDSKVIDHTWRYPNKNGGPDKRFNNNYKIPVCQYGEIKITSNSGLFLYLMTSKDDSVKSFKDGFNEARHNI